MDASAIMIFVGLCLVALAIVRGFSDVATAIRGWVPEVKFASPLRISDERRKHGTTS